jgi:hypothetical protein
MRYAQVVPTGQVLQVIVTPLMSDAFTPQLPRVVPHSGVTGPEPQVLVTHWAETVPDSVMRHICPGGQVSVLGPLQLTVPQAAVWTDHAPSAPQVACVRPVLGQLLTEQGIVLGMQLS